MKKGWNAVDKNVNLHLVAQWVASWAFRPGLASLNPSSANILADVWQKSLTSVIRFFTNGQTVYVEKQPVAWKVCCMNYWSGKARKHMSRWTGRRDMTEQLTVNQSIKFNYSNIFLQIVHKISSTFESKDIIFIKVYSHLILSLKYLRTFSTLPFPTCRCILKHFHNFSVTFEKFGKMRNCL